LASVKALRDKDIKLKREEKCGEEEVEPNSEVLSILDKKDACGGKGV